MKDVKPTSLLKDHVRKVEGNPDFSNKDFVASQPQMVAKVNSGKMSTLSQVELQPEVANFYHPGGHSNVSSQVCFCLTYPGLDLSRSYLVLICCMSICLVALV